MLALPVLYPLFVFLRRGFYFFRNRLGKRFFPIRFVWLLFGFLLVKRIWFVILDFRKNRAFCCLSVRKFGRQYLLQFRKLAFVERLLFFRNGCRFRPFRFRQFGTGKDIDRLGVRLQDIYAAVFENGLQILFRDVVRKTAHRHAFRKPHVPARQRKVQPLRNFPRTLAHHLVKIAEADQDDGVRLVPLRRHIPCVHRIGGRLRFFFLAYFRQIAFRNRRRGFLRGKMPRFIRRTRQYGFVRYRFFLDVVDDLRRVDAAFVGCRYIFFRKFRQKIDLFEQPRVFVQTIRHSAERDAVVLREAGLAVQRISNALGNQTVAAFIFREIAVLVEILRHTRQYLTVIAAVALCKGRAVQLVKTVQKPAHRIDEPAIAFIAVRVVQVIDVLLVAVCIVELYAPAVFRNAPPHIVPFVDIETDGRFRADKHDLAGVVQFDVRILRCKTVKVF